MNINCLPICNKEAVTIVTENTSADLWHQRLGHLNIAQLKEVIKKGIMDGVNIENNSNLSFCEGCIEGKMCQSPFKSVGKIKSMRRLQLIHSDVCGPMQVDSFGGQKYFVTFTDDFSRCCSVYFLKNNSEVFEKFKEFEALTTNQTGLTIGTLRSDNGGEYMSNEFQEYLQSKGVHHELTVPYSPQQNGVSERMNRTLMESARSMMAHAGLPPTYWAEAINTAVYIRNHVPTTALKNGKTPYEQWYERKPNVSHFKVFGCLVYSHVPNIQRQKLDKKAQKLRFVGYSTQSKGYCLFDEESSTIYIRRDITFNEVDFGHCHQQPANRNVFELEAVVPIESDALSEDDHTQPEEQQRRSTRHRRLPTRYELDEYADTAATVFHTAYSMNQIIEPTTMKEAMESPQSKEWKIATNQEYHSLMKNETWELVELPPERNDWMQMGL